jgi:D-alanyl-D-alanine carboxypeptidase (penicillin-binding protein 5/6)
MATALVVAERADLDDEVTVSAAAAATEGGGLELAPGDRYSVRELLYALLLPSSNDAAAALAEHVSGSVEAFVDDMNDVVDELGTAGTEFVTPHGLDAPGHVSTPIDLARIGKELVGRPELAEIVATPETTIAGPEGDIDLVNTNPLVEGYEGAIGIKTGNTALAGDVIVAAARRSGRLLIAVAMRSTDASRDAARLLDYGFARLARSVILEERARVGEVVLDPAGAATVVTGRAVQGLVRPRAVEVDLRVDDSLPASIEPGDVVGTVVVSAGNRRVDMVPAVASGHLDARSDPSWMARALTAVIAFFGILRAGTGG